METSENIDELAKALLAFHRGVGKVVAATKNKFYSSMYASLADILEVINQPLIDAGLVVLQSPHGEYELSTRIQHESGQWIEDTFKMTPPRAVVTKGEPTEITPQTHGMSITYMRRYSLGAILSLNIDEDDDGNQASRTSAPRSASPAPPTDETF